VSPRKRRSQHSGRAPLRSLGRPPVAERSELQRFWLGIAQGMTSEEAALAAGMSQPVGTRMFRKAGGMPPSMFRSSAEPPSGRYLSFAEREEIALLRVQGLSRRKIGRRLGRSASAISRELRRNAATRSGGLEYRASAAQWHADRSGRRPKVAKLALNPALRLYVDERLAGTVAAPGDVRSPGADVGMDKERIGGGARHGVQSR
jgi:Helix-turn-helix domain